MRPLYPRRKYRAARFLPAPVLPMCREEMDVLGWDSCDIVLITGDAYIDHPSFGVALIGRVLEAQGFRVGVVAQPDWNGPDDFRALGRPNLMFGVTSGNMDSMVNRYTADGRRRSDDAYSPDDQPDRRPDRAVIAYVARCRQAYPGVPVVIGGIEASLRRTAHYDYWSDKVRRSILLDSKADLLVWGSGERPAVEIAWRLAAGEKIDTLRDVPSTAYVVNREKGAGERLPSYEEVARDKLAFARSSRRQYLHLRRGEKIPLTQVHAGRDVVINPPAAPLSTRELDITYELPYTRCPHPGYAGRCLRAWEMIRYSVTILRGCFGGCSFCALAAHEGPVIQSRSEASVLREIGIIRDEVPGFTGIISDLGGPTANMYRQGCRRPGGRSTCGRLSCLYPDVCEHLETSHRALIRLMRRARQLPGVKKVVIGSGVRHDLALRSQAYLKELAGHHVGGYLKVAPEHVSQSTLACMQKPGPQVFERFRDLFDRYSQKAGKEQYLVPYFIAAHPGTTDEDMLELALWLKRNGLHVDQVQTFLPGPMTLATAMYHTGLDPLHGLERGGRRVYVPRGLRARRLHKAFLRYHDADNWPLIRKALQRMGREDLIGSSRHALVPARRKGKKSAQGRWK